MVSKCHKEFEPHLLPWHQVVIHVRTNLDVIPPMSATMVVDRIPRQVGAYKSNIFILNIYLKGLKRVGLKSLQITSD